MNYKKVLETVLIDETGCEMCKHCVRLKGGYRDCDLDYAKCNNHSKFELDKEKLVQEYSLHN